MPDTPVVDLDNLDDGTYLRYHAARDEQQPEYATHRAQVREMCSVAKGDTVLEVGCGTGPHLPHFWEAAGPDGQVTALDSSAKMLHLARKRLSRGGVPLRETASAGVQLVLGRLGRVPLANSFDVVLADRLLGHLDDPVGGLRQLAALANPGGRVVVVNMLNTATSVSLGCDPQDRALCAKVLSWRAERGTTSPWAAAVMPSLARQAGLEPVSAKCWTFACGSLHDTFPHTPLLDYGKQAQADGAISAAEAHRWQTRLVELDAAGEFAVSITIRADALRVPKQTGTHGNTSASRSV